MKKHLSIKLLAVVSAVLSFNAAEAQVSQTVTINPNYTHQVYYNMQNGSFPAVDNTNWDIGFQLRGFAASIMINSKNNVQLYRAMKSVADWSTMVASDTTGLINSTYELHNSNQTWDKGAFSGTNDTANQFDLGWGVYDFVTHIVSGDSLYFIKLNNGNFKKFWLESLTNGIYYFRWANLDGSNETTATLTKSLYTGKFFVYYSIQNNMAIDREPMYNLWDLVFTQYLTLTPYIYKVAGVLSNDSVFCAKAYPVDVNTVNPANYSFGSQINTIGYDWKNYDFANNVWAIEDSTVYFVKDRNAGIWKVIFTGFGGGANGDYYFTKQFLGTTAIEENINPLLNIYPNPASGNMNLLVARIGTMNDIDINITNSLGQVVKSTTTSLGSELNNLNIDLSGLHNGIYFLSILQNGRNYHKPFIIQN